MLKTNTGFYLWALCCVYPAAAQQWSVDQSESGFHIHSGLLERIILLKGADVFPGAVNVAGANTISSLSEEISFTLWKATPNAEPEGIRSSEGAGISQEDATRNNTDALKVSSSETAVRQNVGWTDSLTVSGSRLSGVFEYTTASVTKPGPGKTRLVLRFRSPAEKRWEHLSAELVYEICEGFPAIRKWVRFTNNGRDWIKLSHLRIDDLRYNDLFSSSTPLTPAHRGVSSSIMAFSDPTLSKGVISVSEVPSRVRELSVTGSSGYSDSHFEWVLGPSESFESEGVFIYAFSGASYPTVSSVSTALDRCVESDFRTFLKQHILSPFNSGAIPAPLWCSWTNYSANINALNMAKAADVAKRIGFKCFQLDAGWYDQGPGGGWAPSGRNPAPERFSDLAGFGKELRDNRIRLGLWISVFRNEQKSDDLEAIPSGASLPLIRRSGGVGMSLASKWKDFYANDLVYLHDRYGATYFKQDLSNICYGDIAYGHESRTLKESYLRGLRGLFYVQDKVHETAPGIFLQLSHEIYWETPGPPGDVAVLQHADSYHIPPNEYWGAGNRSRTVSPEWTYKPDSLGQALLKGAFRARNLWYQHRGLPLERLEVFGAVTANFQESLTEKIQDRQICSWLMGAPLSFSGDLSSLTESNIETYRKRFALLERLDKTYGIYSHFQYSGVPIPTEEDWHWWGKLDEEGCGAVVVLRGTGGDPSRLINIPWVKTGSRYRLKGALHGTELGVFTGKVLQEGKLKLDLETMGQEIIEISKE